MIYYVNAKAAREGNGRKETPFRYINDAAKSALPGDEIIAIDGVSLKNATYKQVAEKLH